MDDTKSHPAMLLTWCRNHLPTIRNCGQTTQDRIIKSLRENGLLEDCKHEHAHFVQSASGNESWYECDRCGEVVS